MKLSIISVRAKNAGEELDLVVETVSDDLTHTARDTFTLSSKQYVMLGACKGDITEALYDELAHAADVWGAVKKGVALLSYGACSEKALKMKLIRKGFDRELAVEATEQIAAMGLLNAYDDAMREAERQAARLRGKRRIAAELYRKGYETEAVNTALGALEDAGTDYVENCVRLIKKSYSAVAAEDVKRLYAALMRCGYSSEEIGAALKSLERERI